MESIFRLSIFIFFFLLSIKSTSSQDCSDSSSLSISKQTDIKNLTIDIKCDDQKYFILHLDLDIQKNDYDKLTFEVQDNLEGNISFYLIDTDTIKLDSGQNRIELKLSDIGSGACYLEIYKRREESINSTTVDLKYILNNYPETKRFRDEEKFILFPDNTDYLIYEYGISNSKSIAFTIFGSSINIFNFEYEINNNKKNMNKLFFNGYLLVMDNNFFKESKTINFTFSNYNENLTIITYINSDDKKQLNDNNNHFDIFLNDSDECFSLPFGKIEKYIFKFTTYTKNILASFEESDEKINIIEESSYYILDNQNVNKICFRKKENDKAALSFDFLKFENNTINNYYKIIRGLPQRNILYSGMIGYYKPEYYNDITSKADINSQVKKGNIVLSISQNNDNNELKEYKLDNINGYISYKYEINEDPIYAKVECLSEECIFDIDMKGIDEITYFKKDYKVFSYLNDSYTDKYKININDIDNNKYKYLLINIYYLIQKPNVEIYNLKADYKKEETNPIDNIISYNIPIEEIEDLENILINITSNNHEGIYYGLNYEIKEESNNDIYLENGIAYRIDMKDNINLKNFIIKSKPDSKLIINVNTFGNDLILSLNDSDHISKNNLIQIVLNETLEDYYSFKILNNSPVSEQYINLYIYELSPSSKIFIKEGIIYNNKLTKDNNEVNYSLFLSDTRKYTLNFRKYSNSNAKITINDNTIIISKLSELINIEKKDCQNNVCEYLITIEKENKENEETELDFSFQITSYEEEIYLPKNTFINGILEEKKTIIYNGNYENNDEFFIDFLEGEGEASLTIINGETKETCEMDYYNKKINIKENNCKNSNCRFKLELKLNNNINQKYKYNILLRDSSSQISIPAFETIYGVLKNNIKEHKYSIKKISKYYNYELDCNLCEIKEESPTEDENELKFSIKLKEEQNKDFDVYYNFRINFHDNEKIILYHLDSLRNHRYCEINDSNPCYYLTYIEKYNSITNLQFFVQNIKNSEIHLKKYCNKTEEEIYKEIVDNEMIEYDNISDNYLNIENEYKECYLLLKITSNNKNNMKVNLVYDIFKRNYSSMENIYKDDFCLVNSKINNNINIELINKEKEYYALDINLIKEEEKIKVYSNEYTNEIKTYYLLKGFKENFNFFPSDDKKYKIELIAEGTDSIIYFKKIKSKSKSIIKEIYFGKNNYLEYEKEDVVQYQGFYINLNYIDIMNEDIHLNYKYFKYFTEQYYLDYPQDINLEILLVDEKYILNEKEGFNNNNLNHANLGDIIYYNEYMGAGYALLNKNFIAKNKENDSYIFIKLSHEGFNEMEFIISLTDLNENYDMPTNIYLFMMIKDKYKLEIKNNSKFENHFVEISHDSHLNVEYNEKKLDTKTFNGKTFFGLKEGEEIFEFNFTNNDNVVEEVPNLLIKYGFSESKTFSYFQLNNSEINYDNLNQNLLLCPIEINHDFQWYSIIYNILIYNKNNSCDVISLKEKPVASKTIEIHQRKLSSNENNDTILLDISDLLKERYGAYYVNILAEAKLNNNEKENYEFLLYTGIDFQVMRTINITEKKGNMYINQNETIIIDSYISYDEHVDKNLLQYKFIKLVLSDKNNRKKIDIYASTNNIYSKETKESDLYNISEFKSIDSYNNSVLAIPLKSCNDLKLYIYIPYKGERNFNFTYSIEDGRQMEGIKIYDDTCFDITLEGINSDDIYMNYRFVYQIKKVNYPLITFTTYEINNDYELFANGLEDGYLKESFYNGHSFLIEYTKAYFEYHTFIIKPHVTTIFKICHRTIEKNETFKPLNLEKLDDEENPDEDYDTEYYIYKPISIGDNMYSFLKNENGIIKDCFEIEKENDNYEKYMFNYITRTQNMKLLTYDSNKEKRTGEFNISEESGTIFLNPEKTYYFCIGLRDGITEFGYPNIYHGSINFQIVGINIGENANTPLISLINGYSVNHTLLPKQKLYYRLNNYKSDSNFLKLYFQNLEGKISIKRAYCRDYPNYYFTYDEFEENDNIKNIYKNYFYDEIDITENKYIYNKADFPVYEIYCEENNNKNCTYFIVMHNENSILELNEKRKIYFDLTEMKTFIFSTQFYREAYCTDEDDEEKEDHKNEILYSTRYYFEIHLLKGKFDYSKNSINNEHNFHNFDDKIFYYSSDSSNFLDIDFYSILSNLTFEKNSFFYVTYRVLLNKYYKDKKTDDFYAIYENETHYNLLTNRLETFSYYYPDIYFNKDNSPNGNYIVSISGINSYISLEGMKNYAKFIQFELNNSYTKVKCKLKNNENKIYNYNDIFYYKQCEFIFSYAELNKDNKYIFKNVEFDGFYQYYEMNNQINDVYLNYNFTKEELKNLFELNYSQIYININKNNTDEINISYKLTPNTDLKSFNESKIIKKQNDNFRIDLKALYKENENQFNNDDSDIHLIFNLNSNSTFKIKINIKNIPTFLYSDEIEFGTLKPNESLYYYFDYIINQNSENKPDNYEEIYLDNKGNLTLLAALIDYTNNYPISNEEIHDLFNHFNNSKAIYYKSENNFLKIYLSKDNILNPRVFIKVFFGDFNKDINDTNYNNSFSIYRHTKEENGLLAKLNTNIWGNLYGDYYDTYKFSTDDLTKTKGELIVNLNCQRCHLMFDDSFIINSSYIFSPNDYFKNYSNVNFYINGSKGYYFFSFSDSNLPKYIEESEPELCKHSCKFVFPLEKNYDYNIKVDEDSIAQIIFFSPDAEKIRIYAKLVDESEVKNDPLTDFNLDKDMHMDTEINNKVFFNLSISEAKEKPYLRIQAVSEDKEKIFHFIMNKFVQTNSKKSIKHTKQIIYLAQNESENIYYIKREENEEITYYKFNFELISGKGNITLVENNPNYTYELNYEYHPSISVILNLDEYSIMAQKLEEKKFVFFFNVTKLKKNITDIVEQFDYQQNYKIKYYLNNENNSVFPLNLKIGCKQGYKTFVSYRFINPIFLKRTNDSSLYNVSNDNFSVYSNQKNINKDLISFESEFFPDFQRGVITVNPKKNYKDNYFNLMIKKSENNINNYKDLYLELSIVYLQKEENETIYIPKNTYVQLDLNNESKVNKSNIFGFVETNPEYNYFQIEIANNTDLKINVTNNFTNCTSEIKYGKRTYICLRNTTDDIIFNLTSNKSVTVLVKYTTRQSKCDFPVFNISKTYIERYIKDQKEEDSGNQTKAILNQAKIDFNNISNAKTSYFVRLYDHLRLNNISEMDSILVKFNGNISYRRDCDDPEICENEKNFTANFGFLERVDYFISLIGEVTFNDSVEYLSYEPVNFKLFNIRDPEFESKWAIPLVFVLLLFCAIVGYIIYFNIKKYKEKKGKNQESKADILINDGDNVKNMKDVSEEEEDDNKDKEDEDDEEDDELNKNLIKV